MDRYDIAIADALIAQVEGCRLAPYLDSAGVPTIGFGCTTLADGSHVTMHTPPLPDIKAAYDLLSIKLAGTVEDVRADVTVPQSDNQWAALYSFTYNVGPGAFAGSTLRHLINKGAPVSDIAAQFGLWVYDTDPATRRKVTVRGLVNRRAMEAACYLGQAVPRVSAPASIDPVGDADTAALNAAEAAISPENPGPIDAAAVLAG